MPDDYRAPGISLGPCCGCGREDGVSTIVMLPRRAPLPGRGWGCAVCGLPADGAVAVFCDDCYEADPKTVCRGYPGCDGRVPVGELSPDPFDHDMTKHEQDEVLHA